MESNIHSLEQDNRRHAMKNYTCIAGRKLYEKKFPNPCSKPSFPASHHIGLLIQTMQLQCNYV